MDWRVILVLVYVALGLYLINSFQNFVQIPSFISQYQSFIMLASGVLLVISGLMHLKFHKKKGKQTISVE